MKFRKILRVSEWWGSKVPMLLGLYIFFSASYHGKIPFVQMCINLTALLWWICSAAAFGYLINNIFDIEQDIKAGKANFTASLSRSQKWGLAISLASSAFLPWLLLYHHVYILILCAAHLLLFLLYSIPPIRLKERGYLGVIVDALYAFVLPLVIIHHFAIFDCDAFMWSSLPVAIWAFLAGARSILLHHFGDRKSDRISHTGNVVNSFGIRSNSTIINAFVLPLEILAFYYLLDRYSLGSPIFIIAFSIYLLLMCFTATRFGARWAFSSRLRSMRYSPIQFYEGWFLLLVLIYRSASEPLYIILIILQLILFQNEVFHFVMKVLIRLRSWSITLFYFIRSLVLKLLYLLRSIIIESYYLLLKIFSLIKALYFAIKRLIKPVFVNSWHHFSRPILSYIVNYSIYYFRRFILRQSQQQAAAPLAFWKKMAAENTKSNNATTETKNNLAQEEKNDNEKQNSDPNTAIEVAIIKHRRNASAVMKPSSKPSEDNLIVNGLWIGNMLSNIEILTIKSFVAKGHKFRLWVYEQVHNVPAEAEVCDANTIIPASQIFRYKYANAYGHGKGSVSGFSDTFRYKLLYDKGGWWVDMDICCLQALNFDTPYFFRSHHDLDMVGNLMKCPAGSDLMLACYEEARATIDQNNTDWHKPIEILNRHISRLHLDDYIFTGFSNEDKWEDIRRYIHKNMPIAQGYVALHWMNEEWRSRGMNKNDIRYNSTLGKKLVQYGIIKLPDSKLDRLTNDLRHLLWIPLYDRLQSQR